MNAPAIHVPFPQLQTLSELLTSLRDFGIAYPEHRSNIIQHCADLQNWFSAQLPSAGGGEVTT